MKKLSILATLLLGIGMTSCSNEATDFPDFDYSTVYFAYQTPIRTLVLGEDIYDTTLDNAHKCKIMATTGGVYSNNKNIKIDLAVDNTLCDNLLYEDENPVIAMPSSYYTLDANQIIIPKGELMGGVEVQLTDAFFADPKSTETTYVIPLRMTQVQGVDSILSGKPNVEDANPLEITDWETTPKDYILYAVKYINPWTGHYLRRGVDNTTGNNGNTSLDNQIVYHATYVEQDEVCQTTTKSMSTISLPLSTKDQAGNKLDFTLEMTFAADGSCVVTAPEDASYIVTGSGNYVVDGDAWGNAPKDALFLDYNVDFGDATHACQDTLVIRDRGVTMETFTPSVKLLD